MSQVQKISSRLHTALYLLFIAFFIGLIFSFPAVSSISTGLLVIAGFMYNRSQGQPFFHRRLGNFFLIACSAFFILVIIATTYTHFPAGGWSHVRQKSALLFVPLACCCCQFIHAKSRPSLIRIFILILALATLYTLICSFTIYLQKGDSAVLFYHSLVAPIRQHAINYSVYLFIAFVFMMESTRHPLTLFSKKWMVLLMFLFSLALFLLSSKLVISFFLIYLLCFAGTRLFKKEKNRHLILPVVLLVLASGVIVFSTRNPIRSRFSDILGGNLGILKQDTFTPGDYFNGFQFRLLEWRFVKEILDENHRWITGVTPGDAQNELDKKYIASNMYTGETERHDRGFLGYNTHNQFLESLLQLGIAGLLVMLLIAFSVIRMILAKRERGRFFILLLLLVYLFTESLFETQYGAMLFTFFPLFISLDGEHELNKKH